ncbi:hypothetical protein ALC57_18213, partial [Trachymyrmex cornetzi]
VVKSHELNFELVPHVSYSPDLAPSDFFFFPNKKKKEGFSHRESKHLNKKQKHKTSKKAVDTLDMHTGHIFRPLAASFSSSSSPICTTCRVQAVFWSCYIVSYTVSGYFRNTIKINSGGLVGAENAAFEKVYRF